METRDRNGVALHPVEIDLLCTFAEVEPPFPIEVTPAGETDIERAVRFRGAAENLVDRDLADERGPLDVAEEFVYLLRSCTGVVDLLISRDDGHVAVALLTARDEALLVIQDTADPYGMIRLHPTTLDEGMTRLYRMIPRAETPLTAPFSLPRRAVQSAFEAMLAATPDSGTPVTLATDRIEEILAAQGIDERITRRMVSHLQPVQGSGQAGLARRDETEDQWRRTGTEFHWIDTPRGRYRLAGDADWMSVNPLGAEELRAELRTLGTQAHT